MKISNLRAEKSGQRTKFLATATWEDSSRAPVDLFFEIPSEFGEALSVNANAFLTGTLVSAMEAGEKRIAIDGDVCPRLHAGLLTIVELMRHWYGGGAIAIEARALQKSVDHDTAPRAGLFLSGGIDSLVTLQRNRLLFPKTHPESVRDAILLYGINFDSDDAPETFAHALEELAAVANDADLTLIPVYTNLRRDLNQDVGVFLHKTNGAMLAATAHVLNRRLTAMSIASTHDIPNLKPWGSHPLVDPQYSSFDMRIHYDGVELSRIEKTRLVAEWEAGLQNLKVCPVQWPGKNCGRCEKCLRTKLALLALGALERTSAFAEKDITEEEVRTIRAGKNFHFYYRELLDPLRAAGRDDLVRGIEWFMARDRGETGWLGPFKRIDRTHFHDSFRLLKRNLSNGASRRAK